MLWSAGYCYGLTLRHKRCFKQGVMSCGRLRSNECLVTMGEILIMCRTLHYFTC